MNSFIAVFKVSWVSSTCHWSLSSIFWHRSTNDSWIFSNRSTFSSFWSWLKRISSSSDLCCLQDYLTLSRSDDRCYSISAIFLKISSNLSSYLSDLKISYSMNPILFSWSAKFLWWFKNTSLCFTPYSTTGATKSCMVFLILVSKTSLSVSWFLHSRVKESVASRIALAIN